MEALVDKIDSCRSCGNPEVDSILNLGDLYVSDFIDSEDDEALKAPLDIVLCDISDGGCGLLQLKHSVDPEYLFREYWYESGINESMRKSLKNVVEESQRIARLSSGDIILDIGCNDGTMLRMFDDSCTRIGFEPAENLVGQAREDTTRVINDFFSADTYRDEVGEVSAQLVTSIAMFYDLEDPNQFVDDVKSILAKDGVWVIQAAYFPRKIENNAFDSIVHEHLEYYSLLSLENLLKAHDFEIFDMKTNEVNGGSFRAYIRHNESSVGETGDAPRRLEKFRVKEKEFGLHEKRTYEAFAQRVKQLKWQTRDFVEEKVNNGNSVYLYGASTKGNTLLQYYGLNHSLIDGAAERNSDKYGKLTVGTHIPIVPEKEARQHADFFLVLPWHFMDVFVKRESEFLANGGKFIKPLPSFEVIGAEALEWDNV